MERVGGEVPGFAPLLKERCPARRNPGSQEAGPTPGGWPYTTLYPSGGAPAGILHRKTGRPEGRGLQAEQLEAAWKSDTECLREGHLQENITEGAARNESGYNVAM